jgi:anti-sigma factor RsiW
MQPDLPRLIRELKKETCPRRVRSGVRGRIAARESSPRRFRFAIPLAVAGLVLACCLSVGRWNAVEHARQQAALAELNTRERARTMNQAEGALGYVGSVLLQASANSEKVISDRAVPPLRSSLEITKNKIIPNLEL